VRFRGPAVETLGLVVLVSTVDWTAAALGWQVPLALTPAVLERPWTLVTSVYVHRSVGHLLANAVGLLLFGLLVGRATTRARFHAYVVGTGALAGLAEVIVGAATGRAVGVLGASGAVFALLGYLLAGNRLARTVLAGVHLSARARVALFLVVAVGVTLATAAPGVALVAHVAGLGLGLAAGRGGLLRPGRETQASNESFR
jgi:membrane associated rhomboid family serine protease